MESSCLFLTEKNKKMDTNIQFIQTSPEQLAKLISDSIKEQLEDFTKGISVPYQDVLMTRAQVCEFMQINSSTLWHWTNKGKVIAYGIANRRYYKKAELLECLKPLIKAS
jgi:esterase/lipase superfamily enzyme